jgi:hypothetical protein
MSRSSRAKREFFSGCKFQIRMDSVELRIHSTLREIVEFKLVHPNLHIKINNICFKAGFSGPDLAVQFTVREVQVYDYFRNEESISIVHWAQGQLAMTDPDDVNFDAVASSQHTLDDAKSKASFLTYNSKYSLKSINRPKFNLDS